MRGRSWIIFAVLFAGTATALGVLWKGGAHAIAPPVSQDAAAWRAAVPSADDWPWWRGAQATGIGVGDPPVTWSLTDSLTGTAGENVAWRSEIPGRGHASPIVWGSQVFVATADESQQVVSLLSFDRRTGTRQWGCEVQRGDLPKIHQKNSQASATPACDGRQIYVPCVAHDRLWLTAVTLEGKVAWRTDTGPYRSNEGYASSPAIHESLVIVSADSRGPITDRLTGAAYVAAIDRRSGEVVWRVKRPALDSYGSPVVGRICGRDQLLLSGGRQIVSYDPLTGAELWKHDWPMDRTAGNPAFDQERIFVSATIWNAEIVCLRGDASLSETSSRLLWNLNKGVADVPVPLVLGDRLYILNDGGVFTGCNKADGRIEWKKRLKGSFSASPVAVAGRIYAANEDGITLVVDSQSGKILAENPLPEPILASPALAGRQIFIRTSVALYAIEQASTAISLKTTTGSIGMRAN